MSIIPRPGPNICLLTDSYKMTHWKQYPPGTEVVYSYLESRGGEFDETLFFGLQYLLKKYLEGSVVDFFRVKEAEEIAEAHFGRKDLFNRDGWGHIINDHNGRLPVSIRAVAEGTMVPTRNVLMTIENTCPKCFWVTNYLETLLVQVWYPITVATISHYIRKLIYEFRQKTGSVVGMEFGLHDFGFRGVSSVESAGIGDAAHLINFKGTDTLAGIMLARKYYNAGMPAFSIPAAEHSTITSWGRENEVLAMANMLEQYPTGLVACVSDSYNIYEACGEIWGKELKDKVLARDGVLIVRPDSGDPAEVVVKVLDILGLKFGATKNEKGYLVLNPHVRVIQGDGINYGSIRAILTNMARNLWAAENVAFGMGGALLQQMNRDTQRFAFKCSAVKIKGEWKDVYKEPITDSGKNSKRGRLALAVRGHGIAGTMRLEDAEKNGIGNALDEVFRNGDILKEWTFETIRGRTEYLFKGA